MRTHRSYLFAALLTLATTPAADAQPVRLGESGKLVYQPAERGDRIPDFSSCGYAGGTEAPPAVAVRVVVEPQTGDATARIQAAIDQVAMLPLDAQGFRGAVYLLPGEYRVGGQLSIFHDGIVLRGGGAGVGGTTVLATGEGRRPLIRLGQRAGQLRTTGEVVEIMQDYVPVGAKQVKLSSDQPFHPGDRVLVTRPSSDSWIATLGAKTLGVGWRAGRQDIRWERTVTAVDGETVTFDAPLTTAIDASLGRGHVAKILATGRIDNIGVEYLTLRSEFDSDKPHDEEHCWHGIVANHVEDIWVRHIRFQHFAGGAVQLLEGVRRASVEDCLSLAPVSEIGGYRRHSFFTQGQQTLFLRCWAEEGLHDFALGHCAPGPNAYVNCYAYRTHGDSGPLESWASGVLYDNVRIDGGNLFFGNRWLDPPGAGWSAANCLAWQCQAAQIHCFNPPGAKNWVIGYWAQPVGDGLMLEESDFVRPISLFQQQTLEQHGKEAAQRIGPMLLNPIQSTSPTYDETKRFVAESNVPGRTLRDLIEARMAAVPPLSLTDAVELKGIGKDSPTSERPDREIGPLKIVNGWLTIDGQVVTGGTLSPTWWRGAVRPKEAPTFGPSITRFAPGRYGVGLTDELDQVLDQMTALGQVAYDHHYGLWYDRRRDDHLMVRRATSAVAPPFFEQPFARTGTGQAWDGLSRYDLTTYNPWYWGRLAKFAELCDQRGQVLIHQCYFQHNILEAGAHWADCPWRPANNVNATGLSEPPPYVGDKRIFIAHQFYDPNNALLRQLHDRYLRQCIANFREQSNVIHMTSAEYTGPLEFTQFWLDTVHQHREELGGGGLIGLSATKDVQDALLADNARRAQVDLIDIRYWQYDRHGELYAPPGGANLAPRQHMRQLRTGSGDFASVARAVREYRTRFPDKPVTFSAHRLGRTPNPGWAVLLAGGSLADVPPLPAELLQKIVSMRPAWKEGDSVLRLGNPSGEQLCYCHRPGGELKLSAPTPAARYRARWIDPQSGEVTGESEFDPKEIITMRTSVAWLTPID